MSIVTRLKRGEGPLWGGAKRMARAVLGWHLPVNRLTRPLWRMLYRVHVGVREGLIWALRVAWNEPLFRSQCESVGRRFWMEQLPYIQGSGRIVIGDEVRFSGKPQFAFNDRHERLPELLIGDGVFVGHQCDFRVGRSIRIGRRVLIAGGVSIADYDGHPRSATARSSGIPCSPAEILPVAIGNDVWIGQGAVILKGVTIGDRAVIGARAVVTRDVPADCVAAGNPARVIRVLEAGSQAEEAGFPEFTNS